MSDTRQFKITLTPLERFFFGGEIVFGGADAQDDRRRSYLVKSNIFPQQTSLLGMLREELLRQNGLLKPWKTPNAQNEAVNLVGNSGFAVTLDKDKNAVVAKGSRFGIIAGLSPVFLSDNTGQLWGPVPLDDDTGKDDKPLAWNKSAGPWLLENFDPKKDLSFRFCTQAGKQLKADELFASQEQVGITVTNRRNWRENQHDGKEAFFRQSLKRNREANYAPKDDEGNLPQRSSYSFCFWVNISAKEAQGFQLWKKGQVTMGGERSAFALDIEEIEAPLSENEIGFEYSYKINKTPLPGGFSRILLTSDTYLPEAVLEQARGKLFFVSQTISFRFFSTYLNSTNDFFALKLDGTASERALPYLLAQKRKWSSQSRQQSELFTLLKRGGVILGAESELRAFTNAIAAQTAFVQIGYNHYQNL